MDAYLNIAERVILSARCPLRPKEIIELAYLQEMLPHHLHGFTQDKTLHARLSEDIADYREASRFIRTAPGSFFLSSLLDDPDIPVEYKSVYLAPPRRRELRRDAVLLLQLDMFSAMRSDGCSIPINRIKDALERGAYRYGSLPQAEQNEQVFAVNSFVIVHRGRMVLTFRSGKYRPSHDPIRGRRSLGVGGAVYFADADMLYPSMRGIVGSGINELRYGIGLSNVLSEQARYGSKLLPQVGILTRSNSNINLIHVVMSYRCPEDFHPTKSALSVNDLRWVSAANPGNDLSSYDETSKFLILQDYLREIVSRI